MKFPRSVRSVAVREEMIRIAAALEMRVHELCREDPDNPPSDEELASAEAFEQSTAAVRFLISVLDNEAAAAVTDEDWTDFHTSPAPHG